MLPAVPDFGPAGRLRSDRGPYLPFAVVAENRYPHQPGQCLTDKCQDIVDNRPVGWLLGGAHPGRRHPRPAGAQQLPPRAPKANPCANAVPAPSTWASTATRDMTPETKIGGGRGQGKGQGVAPAPLPAIELLLLTTKTFYPIVPSPRYTGPACAGIGGRLRLERWPGLTGIRTQPRCKGYFLFFCRA